MAALKRLAWPLFLAAICFLAFAARCWNLADVFVAGRVYFLDPDCYSRMTRAALIAGGHGPVIRHHDFENFPHGTTPHTTAPLDWLIVAGKWIADGGLRMADWSGTSVLRDQALDLSGALVSPLLGVLACAWLGWWARRQCVPGAASRSGVGPWSVPLLFAVSPVLVHGTALGRPDHQSLLIVLLAVALGAEWQLLAALRAAGLPGAGAKKRDEPVAVRGWSVVAGLGWSLAWWVSLYEPLVLSAIVGAVWLVADRRRFTTRAVRAGWITFVCVMLAAVLIDGWRVVWPDAGTRAAFVQWQTTIGELRHLDLRTPTLVQWLGAIGVLSPVLLGLAARWDRRVYVILGMWIALLLLTLWQLRWGYFLALVHAMSLPWQLAVLGDFRALRRRATPFRGDDGPAGQTHGWLAGAIFLLGLWPVARAWDAALYPERVVEKMREERRAEDVQLRALAMRMRGIERAGFIAPWWLSPALSYWSGQPGVAGSSHEALAGTMETARFFLAPDAATAEGIARRLGARWIITDGADEDGVSRLVKAYGPLLSGAVPEAPWGVMMHERGQPRERVSAVDLRDAPPELRAKLLALAERAEVDELGSAAFACVFKNPFFKLFRLNDSAAPGKP